MKGRVYTAAILLLAIILNACDGDIGPQGPVGPQGPQGPAGVDAENGYIFEYENVDFTGPEYEVFLDYPSEFEGLNTDVTLVYFLWDVQEGNGGEQIDVWRPLPQSVFIDGGTLLYNFDHTLADVKLFLDGTVDLDALTAIDTDDWIVRIVIVPAEFWNGRSSIDFADYNSVVEAFDLPELKRIRNPQKRRSLD